MSRANDNQEFPLKTRYFKVSGRVQGVFFRAATKKMADQYGLKGWVKNLPGGAVEGVVSGNESGLNKILQWLKHGPELARVLELEIKELPAQQFDKFEIR